MEEDKGGSKEDSMSLEGKGRGKRLFVTRPSVVVKSPVDTKEVDDMAKLLRGVSIDNQSKGGFLGGDVGHASSEIFPTVVEGGSPSLSEQKHSELGSVGELRRLDRISNNIVENLGSVLPIGGGDVVS
ncbi:unnamed protein product [Amaranthus hypochondriacus]